MDWQTIFSLLGIVLFVVFMMRGCGGMRGHAGRMTGCGMGQRPLPPQAAGEQPRQDHDKKGN